MTRLTAIAVDVGGTSLKSGLVTADRTVQGQKRVSVDHRASRSELLAQFLEALAIDERPDIHRVAMAVPGPFDLARGISQMVHKFGSIRGVALASELRRALERPEMDFRFVHDAAAAGAGELTALSSTDGTTLMLTLGTGLGAALFDSTSLIENRGGYEISELWRQPSKADEHHSSESADDLFSASGLARLLNVDLSHLSVAITQPSTSEALTTWGRQLGEFITQFTPALDLDRVVIGGGAAAAFDRFGAAVRSTAAVEVTQAKLGSSAALRGAVELAFDGA